MSFFAHQLVNFVIACGVMVLFCALFAIGLAWAAARWERR